MMKRWMLKGLGLAMVLAAPLNLMAQDATEPAKKPAEPVAKVAAAVPVDPSALLKAIPADATAFVAVASLKQFDQDIQDSAKALSLPPNTIPSLTQWFKDSLRLTQGFNENGSLAVVVLNATQVTKPEELENRMALFFAASDPKALSAAMGGKAEGDVIKLELAGEPAFATPRGDFLAVAKTEEALKSIMEAKGEGLIKTVSADRQKAFAKQDIFAWINFRGISKDLRDNVREELGKNLGGGFGPMAALAGNLEQLNEFADQCQELTFGLSLDAKRGITLNFCVNMRPDSAMGKQIAAKKPATGSLLAGLPNEPFVVAGGVVAEPDTERQIKGLLDKVLSDEVVGDKIEKEKIGQIREGIVRLIATVEQLSAGVYGLKAEDGGGMINVTLVATVKDGNQWKQDAKKLFTLAKDAVTEAAKKAGDSEEKIKQATDAIQWKENAEKLGEAEVDQFVVDIAKMPEANAEEVDQAKKVLGPEGVTLRIGALGKNKIMVMFGGGSKRFEAAVKAAAAGEAPLAENAGVKLVADRLPAGPKLLEGFLNIDKLLAMITEINSEVGGPMVLPFTFQNAAPVVLTSLKAGETGQEVELLIPMELAKSIVDAVRPMLGALLGGPSGPSSEPEPPGDNSGLK